MGRNAKVSHTHVFGSRGEGGGGNNMRQTNCLDPPALDMSAKAYMRVLDALKLKLTRSVHACVWVHGATADPRRPELPVPPGASQRANRPPAHTHTTRTLSSFPLTCFGQQRGHAPRHEEDTADEAHLHEKHLPPLANFEDLRNDGLFGRAPGVGVVPLHASGAPPAATSLRP